MGMQSGCSRYRSMILHRVCQNLSSPSLCLYRVMGMVMIAKQVVLRPCSSYPPTTASRLRSRSAKGGGSPEHGASYGLVAGAATQIRGQQLL